MIIENKRSGGFDSRSSGDPDRTEGNWRAAPKNFDGMYMILVTMVIFMTAWNIQ